MIKPMQVRETKYGNVLVLSEHRIMQSDFTHTRHWKVYIKDKKLVWTLPEKVLKESKLTCNNYMFKRAKDIDNVLLQEFIRGPING